MSTEKEVLDKSVTQAEMFTDTLEWLDPNPDVAATVYLQLRRDLTKIFIWNNCSDPEGLVDEVMDRVGKKIPNLRIQFEGDPKLFFYGVAHKLVKEGIKRSRKQLALDEVDLPAEEPAAPHDETAEMREDCLHQCLQKLNDEQRNLILEYYPYDSGERISARSALAQRLGISVETLRVRAHRVRSILEECITKRLKDLRP